MVTLQMSSAAKDWLLEKLSPPVACNVKLAFLGTTAMSVEQGREDAAGSHGPPRLSSETLPQSPGETRTHEVKVCYRLKRCIGRDHGTEGWIVTMCVYVKAM